MPPQSTLWKRIIFAFAGGPMKVVCIAVLIWFILSVTYAFLMPWHRPRDYPRRASCQSNLKQIALAALHYLEDNDTYPLAQNPPNPKWVKTYLSDITIPQVFRCPSDANATDSQKNSYGYNANLSGKKIGDAKSSVSIIMSFEVEAGADNKNQTGKTFEAATAKERHLGGANYSFADGHVKWLKPERINGAKPNEENFTFAVE